jgi:hypothetical protein
VPESPGPTRALREAAVGATPPRLPPQRLLLCGPSLTSSPGRVPPPGMVTERLVPRRTGVSHLAQRRGLILRESCYDIVTKAPTVGNDLVVPNSKRERGVHARYALLGSRSAGGGRRPSDRLGAVPIGPPLALAASRGPGFGPSPARKWRARGRIEHTLLDEGRGLTPTDLRPSLATAPYHKKCRIFLSTTKGRNTPARRMKRPGRG